MSPTAFALPPSHALLQRRRSFLRPHARRQRPPIAKPPAPLANLIRVGQPQDIETLQLFAESVRGEWAGYEGTFDATTGSPQPVPDYYVPEQFEEWGITPLGFESNHSVIVRGTILYRKFFRVLPSVSIFADHVDLEEDFRQLDLATDPAAHIFSDGSYAAGPHQVCARKKSALDKWPAAELCLQDPRDDHRRALHINLNFDFEQRQLVGSVRAVLEKWSCIYCDGADIEGGSGYIEGWVAEKPSQPDALAGTWKTLSGPEEQILKRDSPQRVPAKQLFLPNGIDVAVNGGDGVHVQVGWLVDEATRVVMRRSFGNDGTVLSSQRIVEHRI